MAVKLNHTIVHARDQRESAAFYAEEFGFDARSPAHVSSDGKVRATPLPPG
jgi:hypothetical protein